MMSGTAQENRYVSRGRTFSDIPTDTPTRGVAIWVACIVMPFVAGIFVLLRAYARIHITKKVFLSDWISFVTLVFICAFCGTLAQATYYGLGRHTYDLTPSMSSGLHFWILVSSVFYVLSLAGYKAVLLVLYLQLFGVHRKFRFLCYGVLAYTLGYLFCNLIVQVAGCHPVQKFWIPNTPGNCTNSVAQNIAFGVGHMTSDLMVAILPLPMVWRVQLRSTKERVGLAFALCTGLIAWVVACIRFIYAVIDLTSSDRYWIAGVTFILSIFEVNIGLICGCIPALKPLIVSIHGSSGRRRRKRLLARGQQGSKSSRESQTLESASSHGYSSPADTVRNQSIYTDDHIACTKAISSETA